MDSLKCNVWFFVLTRALHWHTWRASGAFTALLNIMGTYEGECFSFPMCCWWLQNKSITKFFVETPLLEFFFFIKIMWTWGFFLWSIFILMFSFNCHLKFSNSHLEATRMLWFFIHGTSSRLFHVSHWINMQASACDLLFLLENL